MNQANRDHRQYYGILKSHVDQSQWPSFIDQLIKEVASTDRWSNSGYLAWLCIQEERWEELLNQIRQLSRTIMVHSASQSIFLKHWSEFQDIELGLQGMHSIN